MEIEFVKKSRSRMPSLPMSANVHRRGKHMYLHVRLSREAAQKLTVKKGDYVTIGFSSDNRYLAMRWGVPPEGGWLLGGRKDGSLTVSVMTAHIESLSLTDKFHFGGDFVAVDGNTIALPLTPATRRT